MFSAQLYIQILVRVTGIIAVGGIGIAGIVTGKAIILGCIILLITLWLISTLVAFLNTSNRRIQLFLHMIEENESMLCFPENTGSEEQQRLHAAFNRIHKLMAENKRKEFDRQLYRKEYEAWDKLMHVLTHEIMNSIAPIVSLSGTLLSYFQTKEAVVRSREEITDATLQKTIRGLNIVKTQGQSLMHFTDSYRQLSNLKSPTPKRFPLSLLIDNLIGLLQADLESQDIDISVEYPPGEVSLNADQELLSQVLLNLIKNAMQALEETENKRIEIRISRKPEEIRMEVSDNGPGIAPEMMENIFVPFFTTKAAGSGIGLSLSRQIIRMHGGQLLVSSVPYKNTCFTILLPSTPADYNPAS